MAKRLPSNSTQTLCTSAKKDAILVLVDIVEYTPQARTLGSAAVKKFDDYFTSSPN